MNSAFHVLTPLLKQVQSEGWTLDLHKKIEWLLARIHSIECIQLVRKLGYEPSCRFIFNAAVYGYLDLIQFAWNNNFPCNDYYHHLWSLKAAALKGHIDCLDFLLKNGPSLNYVHRMELVQYSLYKTNTQKGIIEPHLQFSSFKYLLENGFQNCVTPMDKDIVIRLELQDILVNQDYSFQITNYLYKEGLLEATYILKHLNDWFRNDTNDVYIRTFFDVNPEIRKLCSSDYAKKNYRIVNRKIHQIEIQIKLEKEGSTVLETNCSRDVLRYVVWNYL